MDMRELLLQPGLVGWIALENLLLINIIGWSFLWMSRKRRDKKQDYEILEMMNQYYEQDMLASKERYDQISMIKHDMRNTLLVVDQLVAENRAQEAHQYLKEQTVQLDKLYQVVKTDNSFVNAILNQKLSEAKAKEIDVKCVILTSFQGIDNKDICNLFGNLLDNAIEANEGAGSGAWLELILEGDQRELEIICRNSTAHGVELRQNHLPITKKDRRWHGYGTRIIKEIVKRYQGEVSYTADGREVEASVRLERKRHEL